jgi:formylglycine-generating enzyme required for sulfatase activity
MPAAMLERNSHLFIINRARALVAMAIAAPLFFTTACGINNINNTENNNSSDLVSPEIAVETKSTRTSELAISRDRCETDGKFAFIPAGEFIVGSDRQERDYGYRISAEAAVGDQNDRAGIAAAVKRLKNDRWFEFEFDRHTYDLESFCIAKNLVTNAEYQEFVLATGYRSPGITEAEYQTQGFLVHPYAEVKRFLWSGNNFPESEANHPVVLVSYNDALAYAQWRSQQDDYTYRLPYSVEWEKAARGADGRYFPWGNEWRDDATNWGEKSGHTSAIGSYPLSRSVYEVEDMAGNVFEYTATLKEREGKPTRAVMKGCSWDDLPGFCRSAYQHTRPIDSRHILFGFRLVRQD